jgi:hypothetical protein
MGFDFTGDALFGIDRFRRKEGQECNRRKKWADPLLTISKP